MLMLENLSSCCHEKPSWSSSSACRNHGYLYDCDVCIHGDYDSQRRDSFLEICQEEFELLGEF